MTSHFRNTSASMGATLARVGRQRQKMPAPPIEQIGRYVSYNPETGEFVSVNPHSNRLGQKSGSLNQAGYRQVKIGGLLYSASRIAWLLVYGEWPVEIDHINRVRDDNRICNLRPANRSENCANRATPLGKSGLRGVYRDRRHGQYFSKIQVRGKIIRLGSFRTKQEASAAYEAASSLHRGEFAS